MKIITDTLLAVAGILAFCWFYRRAVLSLHMFQLDSYSSRRLWHWLVVQEPTHRLFEPRFQVPLAILVMLFLAETARPIFSLITVVLAIACFACTLWSGTKTQPAKKPLVYTARAIRILITTCILIVLSACATWLWLPRQIGWAVLGATVVLVPTLAPLLTIVANVVLVPLQWSVNRWFVVRARRKLARINPLVIGITGSFGKTSTKYFLHTLLAADFEALKTPESYNTFMGVCRVINEQLQDDHKVFIAEMGAYQPGDIAELAKLTHPTVGVLTAIGPQHLERFGTIDAIEHTKYELIQALPQNGVAVFNYDDERCAKLADRTQGPKVLRYGISSNHNELEIWATDELIGPDGVSFTLVTKFGERVQTTSRVLGRHNLLNIVGAACVARQMGMSLNRIGDRIKVIEPVPHRLQLIKGRGGVTVIDDSYNSNPVGVREALNVLRAFKSGKRVLVTPGMVELGAAQERENAAFGAVAAEVCDYVLIVQGASDRAILEGLLSHGFSPSRVKTVRDLSAAATEIGKIVSSGDVVLFENDLPDLYAQLQ
jgi:UDP-N-acetylmuramoyl-tripeptide--D-alanyl-D-alanine ligase